MFRNKKFYAERKVKKIIMEKSIKKFKYLLLILMSVFVLISCSYIWNEFKDTVDEMKHEGEKKRRIPKNDDYAIETLIIQMT